MAKKDKIISPQFFYNKKQAPSAVYLSIDDYTAFMNRFEKLSNEIRQQELRMKKNKK